VAPRRIIARTTRDAFAGSNPPKAYSCEQVSGRRRNHATRRTAAARLERFAIASDPSPPTTPIREIVSGDDRSSGMMRGLSERTMTRSLHKPGTLDATSRGSVLADAFADRRAFACSRGVLLGNQDVRAISHGAAM
jgi:hypothetical protein